MKIQINVNDYDILCTLISGFEGGISYWCRAIEGYGPLAHCAIVPVKGSDHEAARGALFAAWCESGKVIIFEHDAQDCEHGDRYVLDAACLARGLAVMCERYAHHFASVIDSGGDATTGDVLIQCAIFGQLVYG